VRKFLATLVLVVTSSAVAAGSALAQSSSGDSVAGASNFGDNGNFFLSVNARSGPSGESPVGAVSFSIGNSRIVRTRDAAVTCLSVSGSTAVVGVFGRIEFAGFEPDPLGFSRDGGFLVYVRDNGLPVGGDSFKPVDAYFLSSLTGEFFSTPPTDCVAAPPFPSFTPLVPYSGDFTVRDASAMPTSKDQCKNGGFARFGFKNQGQCVAFVQRGPKP
jgi:hypothetical protein